MEGRILGNRYEIIKKIGDGGMAHVYKAKCRLLNRYVAVKILKSEFIHDQEFVKRFRIEGQAAASLSHPNIVSIYDVGKEDDIHYIVMEYIDGITLKEYIASRGRLDWEEAVRIAIQICSAIEHAHKNYIIHRDIKPQNIMMTVDGMVKVTDFGIARAVTSSTITMVGNTMGSVHYFSPEQARGGYVDQQSDLYSLGIVIYEMVTGQCPFNGDAPVAVALQHIQNAPTPPIKLNSSIPIGVNDIIMKAIEKNTKNRYQTATQMLSDLYKVLKQPDLHFRNVVDDTSPKTIRLTAIGDTELQEREESDISNRKAKRKRRDRTILSAILVSIIIISVFVVIGYKIVLPEIYTGTSSNTIKVQDYVGRNFYEVKEELEKYNIRVIDHWEYNEEVKKDVIVSQSVLPGVEFIIDGYNQIEFRVSMGPERITIPDVENMEYREAERQLLYLGLKTKVLEEYSDTIPVNHVIRTDPSKGTSESAPGDEVIIYKSIGPKIEQTTVPDLTGMTLAEATAELEKHKLKVGALSPDDEVSKIATIKEHFPKAGEVVDEGTAVALVFDMATAQITITHEFDLSNPDDYERDSVKFLVEIKQSNQKNAEMLINKRISKDEFPIFLEIPIPANGYTDVLVLVDNKPYDRFRLNFSDYKDRVGQ